MIVRCDVIIKKHNNGFRSRTSSKCPPTVARTIPDSSLSEPRESENFNNSDSSFSDPDRIAVLSDTSAVIMMTVIMKVVIVLKTVTTIDTTSDSTTHHNNNNNRWK